MMKIQPGVYKEIIKTDKHGNRHYRTNACPKCGGTGNVGYTIDDGRCWKCGATGKGKERNVVEYTPDQAQMRAERATAKRLGPVEQPLERLGFSRNGEGYRPLGDTFSCRERIKAAGGVFQRQRFWIMPAKPDFIESEPVTFDIRECGQLVKYDVVSIGSYMRAKSLT